jgi:hypothetical protein
MTLPDRPAESPTAHPHADPSGAEAELQEAVLLPPKGLVATTLLLLVATAALAILTAPPAQDIGHATLRLDTWPGDARTLEEIWIRDEALLQRARRAASQDQAGASIRAGWAAWLRMETELGALDVQHSYEARQRLGQVQEQVRDLVQRAGADAWRAVAVQYGRDVREATQGLVTTLAADATWTSAPPAAVAALEAVAPGWGSTVQHLNLQRFVEQGQLTAAAARLVEALAQQRILSLGARLPRPPQLASDQLELILRFRVEAHPALSLERKLVLLQQLASSDPSYPSVYVRGVLLAREGDCHGAIDAWRQAITMRQSAAVARANLRWCEQRLQAPAVE